MAQVLLELCGDGQCILEQGSLWSAQAAQFQQLMGWSSSALMFQPCSLLAPASLLNTR